MADLARQAQEFANELEGTLRSVLASAPDDEIRLDLDQRETHFVVEPPGRSLVLFIKGVEVGRLELSFFLILDSTSTFLKVMWSRMALVPVGSNEPVVRWEFDPRQRDNPASHWHVHGENGALSVWLARAHPSHRNAMERWGFSSVHLPTGGERWRPCVEDFLEMVVRDFGVDVMDGWIEVLRSGRADWRDRQLRTTVRDNPTSAAEVLRALGYEVAAPDIPPETKGHKIRRY